MDQIIADADIIDDAQAVLDNIDHVGHDDSPNRYLVREVCERIVETGITELNAAEVAALHAAGAERMQMDLINLMSRMGLLAEEF